MTFRISKMLQISLICLLLAGAAIYAVKAYKLTFTNSLHTGSTDVVIRQYEKVKGGEQLIEPGVIMPNRKVSYIPRVTNLRAEGYVRVKVDITAKGRGTLPVELGDIYGLNEDWIRRGDFFYYRKIMGPGESSDLFEGFRVPAQLAEDAAHELTVSLTAHVIQSEGFEPDFSSSVPWGAVVIEQAKENDNINYGTAQPAEMDKKVTYTGECSLESGTEDLFSDFSHLMAGTTVRDSLEMENSSENNISVLFRTQTEENPLLEKIRLRISCGEEMIYEGPLNSETLEQYREIAEIPTGAAKSLNYELTLAEDAGNLYSVLKEEVRWQFMIKENSNENIRTGDSFAYIPALIAAVMSLIVICLLMLWKGGRTND